MLSKLLSKLVIYYAWQRTEAGAPSALHTYVLAKQRKRMARVEMLNIRACPNSLVKRLDRDACRRKLRRRALGIRSKKLASSMITSGKHEWNQFDPMCVQANGSIHCAAEIAHGRHDHVGTTKSSKSMSQ